MKLTPRKIENIIEGKNELNLYNIINIITKKTTENLLFNKCK